MIAYIKIEKKYIPQIARVWRDGLKDNLYSILGLNFIKEYLRLILDIKENKLFVAFNKKERKVVGFVIFGNEKNINIRILKKNILNFFFIIFKKVFLLKFKDAIKFIDVLTYLILSKFYNLNLKDSTELLIIVISESYRSKKIGEKLVNKSIKVLKKDNKSLKLINVTTLNKLKRTINFYIKNKFILKKKVFNRLHLIKKI